MTPTPLSLRFLAGPMGGGGIWPAIPSREQLCTAKSSFQGLTAVLPSFGAVPFTDGVWTSEIMTLADRMAAYAAKRAAGDQIATLNVSWAYNEPGITWPVPGRDLSNNLPLFKAYVTEAIGQGFYVEISLAGDGMSVNTQGVPVPLDYRGPFGYNDPIIGWSYGWQWLMVNFPRIYAAMGPTPEDARDARPYIRWRAGYDGMIGWQPAPSLVDQWLMFFRAMAPNGVLAIELPGGFWAWSGESDDYNAERDVQGYGRCVPGHQIDVVQYEFPVPMGLPPYPPPPFDQAPWDPAYNQVLQPSKRLLGPTYRRPPGLPDSYDPGQYFGGPLSAPTPRGPRCVQAYELSTYDWDRNRITPAGVQAQAKYLHAMGYAVVSVPSWMLA